MGSIITGIATVNQAGAIGAGGALIMAGYRLTEGSKGRYYPAILAIISLLIISYCLSNFDMNVKDDSNEKRLISILEKKDIELKKITEKYGQ